MDERCKPSARRDMDSLFGIARATANLAGAQADGRASFVSDLGECKLAGLSYDASVAEKDLRAAGGSPLGTHGGAPLGVVNHAGKGAAVFLNTFMDAYQQRRTLAIEEPLRRAVQGLLLVRGVRPEAGVSVDATPRANVLINRFAGGGASIVTVVMNSDGKTADWSAPLTLDFPNRGHVYDLRKGAWIGETGTVKTTLLAGDAAIYAVLPARITSVTVAANPAHVIAGQAVSVSVRVMAAQPLGWRHAVRVEVRGPDGGPRPHYGAVVAAEKGLAELRLSLALNDSPGTWTVTARDVVSGLEGKASFVVAPPPRPSGL